jgi:UDP-N-acetylglucosamine diphosphorylase/glucosamine-1-phosphate N-acetyltransferase
VSVIVLLESGASAPASDVFAPVTTARPLAEVRAGAALVRERWATALERPVAGVIAAPRLTGFEEPGSAPVLPDDAVLAAGTVVARSHFAPALLPADLGDADCLTHDGVVVASVLREATAVAELRERGITTGSSPRALAGWMLRHAWDLVGHLPEMLTADTTAIAMTTVPPQSVPDDVRVLGRHPVRLAGTAVIEPFVVLDATQGAIIIGDHAVVRSFSRLTGPFVLGAHSTWVAGSGHTMSIGDHCKVSGEASTSIICGHANKGHDGFLGHSYLGRWTNLGAGTVTSNLKNTYGPVSFSGTNTGLQFLGSILGDHAKTGILTRLTTGSCIGAGANVISDDVVPNVMPPFAWGSHGELYDRERFLNTAARVMARRQVRLTDGMRACLGAVHDAACGRTA